MKDMRWTFNLADDVLALRVMADMITKIWWDTCHCPMLAGDQWPWNLDRSYWIFTYAGWYRQLIYMTRRWLIICLF